MRTLIFALGHMEYTIELAEALSDKIETHLFIPYKKAERFKIEGGAYFHLHKFHQPRLRNPSNALLILDLIKKFKQINPDILHIQGEHPWFDLSLPYLKRKYPVVITVHDVSLHSGDRDSSKIPQFVYDINRRSAHQYIVHGKLLREEMVSLYKKEYDQVNVLYRGINSIYNRYDTISTLERNVILFFGRIWDYKGLKYLIEAEPLISREIEDIKIVIAGHGDDFEKYDKLMVNRDKYEIYNEFIPNEKIPELFSRASIVVLPYTDASQSGVVPLAYAFKKPVIVTDVGSLPEVVDNGKTGFIVPPCDAKAIAKAVVAILKDEKLQHEMGANSYQKAVTELAWDSIAANTIEVYKKAIERKRS